MIPRTVGLAAAHYRGERSHFVRVERDVYLAAAGGGRGRELPSLLLPATRVRGDVDPRREVLDVSRLAAVSVLAVLVVLVTALTADPVAPPGPGPHSLPALDAAPGPVRPLGPAGLAPTHHRAGHVGVAGWKVVTVLLINIPSYTHFTTVGRGGVTTVTGSCLQSHAASLRAARPLRPLRPSSVLGAVGDHQL